MFNAFDFEDMNQLIGFVLMYSMGAQLFEKYANHPEMKKLLESDEKFDVCVFEVFANDAFFVRIFLRLVVSDLERNLNILRDLPITSTAQ